MKNIDKFTKYYIEGKITNTVLMNVYIFHINDFETLDTEMIKNIHDSSIEDKMKLIIALNKSLQTMRDFIINSDDK